MQAYPISRRKVDYASVHEVRLVTELLDYGRLEQLALILLELQNEARLEGDVFELQQKAQIVEAQTTIVLVVVAELNVPVAVHILHLL